MTVSRITQNQADEVERLRSAGRTERQIETMLSAAGRPEVNSSEDWRWVPGFRARVTSSGEVRGARGNLLVPFKGDQDQFRVHIYEWTGEKVTALRPDGMRRSVPKRRSVSVAGCVASAFGLCQSPFTFLRHLDGNRENCRLENLAVPARTASGYISMARPEVTAKRADFPWTAGDDKKLRLAKTINEALRTSRHGKAHSLRRIAELGIQYDSWKIVTPLADRDLDVLREAIDVLETAGVADRAINMAINIEEVARRGTLEIIDAKIACISELHGAGWSRAKIGAAFGWNQRTVGNWLARAGASEIWGAPTKAGFGDDAPGEEWRPCGWGYDASNFGRIRGIRGARGLLSPSCGAGRIPRVTLYRPEDRTRITVPVAALVLRAFKPSLPFARGRHVYRNGNGKDVTLLNLLPEPSEKEQREMVAQCRSAVPGWIVGAEQREDMTQAAYLLMLEGLADTPTLAVQRAVKEYNAMTGRSLSALGSRNISLSDTVAGTEGLTLGDIISSDVDRV